MLYESLSGGSIFLWMCLSGFLSGILFDFKNTILKKMSKKFKKINFFEQFLMFFCVFFAIFAFYITNLKVNFGQFRLFTAVAFLLALSIERILVPILLAFFEKKCYNFFDGRKQRRKEK